MFVLSLGTLYSIYVILASSMELEYGELGLPNFAKVAFFAIGAFTVGALSVRLCASLTGVALEGEFKLRSYYYATLFSARISSNPLLGLTVFFTSLIVAIPLSMLLGILASYPALRLREDYLATTLIAFSEILRVVTRNYEPLLGGTFGAGVVDFLAWLRSPWRELTMLVLCSSLAAGIWFIQYKLSTSPFGRVLRAIRDDELASVAYGKDVVKMRAWTMAIGSGMASVAGVLYAFYIGSVNPDDFTVARTFLVVLMVTVGGRGNPYGPLVGAAAYLLMDRLMLFVKHTIPLPFDVNYFSYIILGVLILVIIVRKPEGLIPERPLLTVKLNKISESNIIQHYAEKGR